MRAHFNRPLTDREGNQVDQAQVRLLMPGTTDLISEIIYTEATGGLTRTNPWTITNGEVDFYLDVPARVQIGVTVSGSPEELWDNIDVLAVATDSTHPGAGTGSTQVGLAATAAGSKTLAAGSAASADADQSTALGYQAHTTGEGTLAVGYQAQATQPGAVAAGQSALAGGTQAVALGDGAQGVFDRSVAVGPNVVTTRPDQVLLGGTDGYVEVPGTLVLTSPDGTTYTLAVTDDGMLYAQRLDPYDPPPPPDEGSP